jgi:hypothetical protein
MTPPPFFDQVPRLRVRDPLAELLGCCEGGVIEYGYADAVRVTGHSCPLVATAYWLTWRALDALYPDALPVRGGIKVDMRESARHGSTGVTATVVQMLTGAAGSSGFKGIAGRFSRAGLQRHAPQIPLAMRFTRLETGAAVDAAADLSLVPASAALVELTQRLERGTADDAALAALGRLWQERVATLLIERADDPAVFLVRHVDRRRDDPGVSSAIHVMRPVVGRQHAPAARR